MTLYSKAYQKNALDHPKGCKCFVSAYADIAQRCADFTQPLTQDDTVHGRWMRSLGGYCHGTVTSRVSGTFDICSKFNVLYSCTLFIYRIPLKTYAILAFLTVATMGLSNSAVGYLNYPTQVIFKCCKLIPVMIGGVLIQSKFGIRVRD